MVARSVRLFKSRHAIFGFFEQQNTLLEALGSKIQLLIFRGTPPCPSAAASPVVCELGAAEHVPSEVERADLLPSPQ